MISDARAMWPAWSPDGTRIAFATVRMPTDGWETHVSDLDGSNDIEVNSGTGQSENPDWQAPSSPDTHDRSPPRRYGRTGAGVHRLLASRT